MFTSSFFKLFSCPTHSTSNPLAIFLHACMNELTFPALSSISKLCNSDISNGSLDIFSCLNMLEYMSCSCTVFGIAKLPVALPYSNIACIKLFLAILFFSSHSFYFIGLIVDSMKSISSCVKLYLAYNSASVHGLLKSCIGTKQNLSLDIVIDAIAWYNINLANFVLK